MFRPTLSSIEYHRQIAAQRLRPVAKKRDLDFTDHDEQEFVTLEEAGLEESRIQPVFGFINREETTVGSLHDYCDWFYEGDNNQFSD